jgi:hypothetical protein
MNDHKTKIHCEKGFDKRQNKVFFLSSSAESAALSLPNAV